LALAWNFANTNYGLPQGLLHPHVNPSSIPNSAEADLTTVHHPESSLLLEAQPFVEKVESLFDRYLKQWDEGKPVGAHNVPRRGQLRQANVTGKRTYKEFVKIKGSDNDSVSGANGDQKADSKGQEEMACVEITSQNLEDNASIIQSMEQSKPFSDDAGSYKS